MREQQRIQEMRAAAATVYNRMTTDASQDWGMAIDSLDWVPGVMLMLVTMEAAMKEGGGCFANAD